MQAMSVEELNSACVKILENAANLIEEAELLFAHDHYARAFTLAHLSCEELAKPLVLHHVAVQLALGATIDWKLIGRRLSKHEAKIQGGILADYLRTAQPRDTSHIDELLRQLGGSADSNTLKNKSLYVSLEGATVEAPSDVITQPIAEECVRLARTRLEFARSAETMFANEIGMTEADLRQWLQATKMDAWVQLTEQIAGRSDVSGSPLTPEIMRNLLSHPDI